jgi:biopolymer transport protein ExbD
MTEIVMQKGSCQHHTVKTAVMAAIQQNDTGKNARRPRHNINVDMTPLVDLAFLLLTFFILTRTFQSNYLMQIEMPDKSSPPHQHAPVPEKNVLNLVLAANHKVYWWLASEPSAKVTDYSGAGLRKLLLDQYKANPKLVLLIKPQDDSDYENLVDALDEVAITRLPRYFIVDFAEDDKHVIDASLAAANNK